MNKKRVLFLCTGNSARSQMAEGLVNHFLADRWHADSAGTSPAGYVHPLAIQAMQELDIDISANTRKSLDQFRDEPFDLVVTSPYTTLFELFRESAHVGSREVDGGCLNSESGMVALNHSQQLRNRAGLVHSKSLACC